MPIERRAPCTDLARAQERAQAVGAPEQGEFVHRDVHDALRAHAQSRASVPRSRANRAAHASTRLCLHAPVPDVVHKHSGSAELIADAAEGIFDLRAPHGPLSWRSGYRRRATLGAGAPRRKTRWPPLTLASSVASH